MRPETHFERTGFVTEVVLLTKLVQEGEKVLLY